MLERKAAASRVGGRALFDWNFGERLGGNVLRIGWYLWVVEWIHSPWGLENLASLFIHFRPSTPWSIPHTYHKVPWATRSSSYPKTRRSGARRATIWARHHGHHVARGRLGPSATGVVGFLFNGWSGIFFSLLIADSYAITRISSENLELNGAYYARRPIFPFLPGFALVHFPYTICWKVFLYLVSWGVPVTFFDDVKLCLNFFREPHAPEHDNPEDSLRFNNTFLRNLLILLWPAAPHGQICCARATGVVKRVFGWERCFDFYSTSL